MKSFELKTNNTPDLPSQKEVMNVPETSEENLAPEQKQEQREKEIMSQKHKAAILLNELDELDLTTKPKPCYEMTDIAEKKLKKVAQNDKINEIINKLSYRYADVENDYYSLLRGLNLDPKKDYSSKDLGKYLFLDIAGFEPKGTIRLERHGLYLLIVCEDNEDHIELLKKISNKNTCSVEKTYGFYTNSSRIASNLIVASGAHGKYNKQRTFLHERQHAINSLFATSSDFTLTENTVPFSNTKKHNIRRAFGELKDELLCRIKEGAISADSISELLKYSSYSRSWRDKLYKYNRETFTQEPRSSNVPPIEDIYEMIDSIVHELEGLKNIFNSPELNGILVYMLVDVPFERMPKYLNTISKYFNERIFAIEELKQKSDESIEDLPFSNNSIFPDSLTDVAKEIFNLKADSKNAYQYAKEQIIKTKKSPEKIAQEGLLKHKKYKEVKEKNINLLTVSPHAKLIWPRTNENVEIASKILDHIYKNISESMILEEYEDYNSNVDSLSPEFYKIISVAFKKYSLKITNCRILKITSKPIKSLLISISFEDSLKNKSKTQIEFPVIN